MAGLTLMAIDFVEMEMCLALSVDSTQTATGYVEMSTKFAEVAKGFDGMSVDLTQTATGSVEISVEMAMGLAGMTVDSTYATAM